jgi:hypothetical protein
MIQLKKTFAFILVAFLLLPFHQQLFSQEKNEPVQIDTLVKKSVPWKAALMSAIVPGLGQIYNKRPWKVPLVYAGLGTFFYLVSDYNSKYQYFKDAYGNANSPGPSYFYKDERWDGFTQSQRKDIFLKYKDNFRRYRDLNMILLSVFYILNIVDASVDAYFMYYDISGELAIQVSPAVIQVQQFQYQANNNFVGLKFNIRF